MIANVRTGNNLPPRRALRLIAVEHGALAVSDHESGGIKDAEIGRARQ